jgi:hypothetical protein
MFGCIVCCGRFEISLSIGELWQRAVIAIRLAVEACDCAASATYDIAYGLQFAHLSNISVRLVGKWLNRLVRSTFVTRAEYQHFQNAF